MGPETGSIHVLKHTSESRTAERCDAGRSMTHRSIHDARANSIDVRESVDTTDSQKFRQFTKNASYHTLRPIARAAYSRSILDARANSINVRESVDTTDSQKFRQVTKFSRAIPKKLDK